MSRIRTMKQNPAGSLWTAGGALERGLPLERSMTYLERLAVAVAWTEPTHALTLTSTIENRGEFAHFFRLLRQRVQRRTSRPKVPLIYVGSFACGNGDGGYHAHLLLWGYVSMKMLHPQLRELGLGLPEIKQITPDPHNRLVATSYALSQHEPIFGHTRAHSHHDRDKGARRFTSPQRSTLARHHPKLLHALDVARDQSLSDKELCEALPRFIITSRHRRK